MSTYSPTYSDLWLVILLPLVDCWDGENDIGDDEPVIYHGHTFTSKIFFKDVIEAVDSYCFEESE